MTDAQGSGAGVGTREVILDAAQEFLVRRRLRDMTVSALMEPIPVTREAFYKHFSSRYEVVAALLGRFTAEVAEDFGIWLRGHDPVRDVPAMFDAASHTYLRRASLLRAVVDAAPLDPDLEAVWRAFLDHFIDAAAERIRTDQDAGHRESIHRRPVGRLGPDPPGRAHDHPGAGNSEPAGTRARRDPADAHHARAGLPAGSGTGWAARCATHPSRRSPLPGECRDLARGDRVTLCNLGRIARIAGM